MKEQLTEMLTRHEGLRLKPYRCTAGKLTIGIGRNIEDVGITQDEAEYLLSNDIDKCIADLTKALTWFVAAPEMVQIVLVNMCFNLGLGGLLKFKNTLLLIRTRDYKAASVEMLNSNWAKQVGKRAVELSGILKNT